MSEQPTALRLAKWLDAMPSSGYALPNQAAAELRRLHEVNQQLLAALNAMLTHMGMDEDEWNKPTFDQARAAIAKGEQA